MKICHVAKVVLWLSKETTTTSSDFMKIPQGVVVVTFYTHDAMRDKFQTAEGSVSVGLVSLRVIELQVGVFYSHVC